jgi:hypothetical protein
LDIKNAENGIKMTKIKDLFVRKLQLREDRLAKSKSAGVYLKNCQGVAGSTSVDSGQI